MKAYFTTTGGREGRNSGFYKLEIHAQTLADVQNKQAVSLNINDKVVYLVGSCDANDVGEERLK